MKPGDFMSIGTVDQALAAEKLLTREIDEARKALRELEKQEKKLVELRQKLCPHTKRETCYVSASSGPSFPEGSWHTVTCVKCGKAVDLERTKPEWHWD